MKSTISLADMRTWQTGMLQSAVQRYTKRLADDYLMQYDLTTMQWLIIGTISEHQSDGIRATDLAAQACTTLSFMTMALNELAERSIVQRLTRESDNRTKLLIIHPDYTVTVTLIEQGLRQLLRKKLYSKLTRQQLETYVIVLQLLANERDNTD